MNKQFVIVEQYDNCDPTVHGTFKTKELAERKAKELTSKYDDYDWGHSQGVVIREVKQ